MRRAERSSASKGLQGLQRRKKRNKRDLYVNTNTVEPSEHADAATMADEAQRARRVAIFVEPSPFSHVSGMKNRFLRLIEDLSTTGDDVRPWTLLIFPRSCTPAIFPFWILWLNKIHWSCHLYLTAITALQSARAPVFCCSDPVLIYLM